MKGTEKVECLVFLKEHSSEVQRVLHMVVEMVLLLESKLVEL